MKGQKEGTRQTRGSLFLFWSVLLSNFTTKKSFRNTFSILFFSFLLSKIPSSPKSYQ